MASLELLLLRRFTLRHWRLAPRQSLLLVAILALGVAVFIAVRLANRAAVASFTHFTDTLTGQSDWIIQPPAGTLPESVLPELRAALGARPVHLFPVVESTAVRPRHATEGTGSGRTTYTLLGVDLIAVANLARQQAADTSFFVQKRAADPRSPGTEAPSGFWPAFRAGPQIWISPALSAQLAGARTLELIVNEQVHALPVAGVIPHAKDAPRVPANLILLDLPHLQRLAGKTGRLDRVEFLVEPGPRADERREELHTLLEKIGTPGERWTVTSPGARRESAATMTRAFRLNLTVLSLIALLVGLYLIFQALDGAVVRRRSEIAILRSLGVEEGTLRRAWLAEAAVLGLLGGAFGLLLGWAGAQFSVRAVGQTVNALYYATTVGSAGLDAGEIVLGLVLGLVASLAAGWWPAREAARTPPAQVLVRHAAAAPGHLVLRSAWLGGALLLAGCICAQLPPVRFAGGGRFPLAGYLTAFLWILGGGILCGFLLPLFARLMHRARTSSAVTRVALSHLAAPSGRHRLAVAALLCAVGMTAGMAILVASFETTVSGWVRRSLQADLYISSNGTQSASSKNRISPATWRAVAADPAVAVASVLAAYPIELAGTPTLLTGTDLRLLHERTDLPWAQAPLDEAVFDPARNAALLLASESFCERFRKKRGDTLRVPTPAGPQTFTIAGVYADYGNERGALIVQRDLLVAWFNDDQVANLSLYLRPGADAESLRTELLARHPGLVVYTNATLRAEILRVFRQTFSITYALEVIGVAVAVIGLALTLISVLLDRREELTTLRALGFTRREMARATALEGTALAAAATVGGLTLSLGLGWLLIHVINKQSFGWTLGFALPWGQLAALAATVVLTGAVVSHVVGRWGADLPADREE
ncbi:MAG: FtsX-like permease family protein [Verrucomicrobia bacterium]|nr:FtsX-like permease family protein [Verrucomicrobiota bacterium]